jgi:tetratricopeptide (TPR) repeat protein
LDAAEAVCNPDGDLPFEVVDGITSLLEKSLLQRTETADGQPRVTMLETIREYALERLEQSAGADATRQRHASYFCTALHTREADFGSGGRAIEASEEIAAEIDNIRAAWQWAVDHDDLACLQRGLESLQLFYVMRGMAAEGMSAFGRAIDKLSAGVVGELTPEHTLTLGRLLVRQSWLLWRANQLGSCETMQRGVELLEAVELDTRAERATALVDLSQLQYYVSGDPNQAEESIMNGLALARAIQSDSLEADLLSIHAQQLEFQGEARAAAEQFRASLAGYDKAGDMEGRASALNNWGRAAYAMGEYPQARQLIEEALHIRRRSDERYGISYSLLDLGRLAEFAGDYTQARELIGQSLAVAEQLQSGDHSARAYVALGAIAHAEGQFNQAEDYFQRALRFWRVHRIARGPSLCLNGLAEVALDRGDIARARAYLEESLAIAQQLRNVGEAAVAELGMGRIALACEALDQAAAHLRRALQIAERTGAAPLALDALIVVAQLESSGVMPRIERAVELLVLVSQHPAARHATRARAAKFLEAVIATLPLEVAQAAQARSQAIDLWATARELLAELAAARDAGAAK